MNVAAKRSSTTARPTRAPSMGGERRAPASTHATWRQFDQWLTSQGQLAIVWGIEDVRRERPDLSLEQALAVLLACPSRYDPEQGIGLKLVREVASELFPRR